MQLDGPHAGQNYDKDEDEEEDFYEAANAMPVRENNVTVALHRSDFSQKLAFSFLLLNFQYNTWFLSLCSLFRSGDYTVSKSHHLFTKFSFRRIIF